jgi:hypothetical protein
MIFLENLKLPVRGMTMTVAALLLAACAAPQDDLTNTRLTQPPAGVGPMQPTDAGDIVIAGQRAAHAIMDLPEVAQAATPPLVQFTGVTSIVVGPTPVDTEPYTTLLRDRLLLLTREKLRFVERELPPLVVSSPKKSKRKKAEAPPPAESGEADYQILAELHGRYDDPFYKVQIEFVDIHTGNVLFNALYRINKEMPGGDSSGDNNNSLPPPPAANGSTQ